MSALKKHTHIYYNRYFLGMQVAGVGKMKEIPRYEKVILLITVGCLLLFSGWFLAERNVENAYQVILLHREEKRNVQGAQEDKWPDSLLPREQININTAQEEDLQRIPGIGEKLAREIVLHRKKYGKFECVDELIYVSGIGESTLEKVRKYICVVES